MEINPHVLNCLREGIRTMMGAIGTGMELYKTKNEKPSDQWFTSTMNMLLDAKEGFKFYHHFVGDKALEWELNDLEKRFKAFLRDHMEKEHPE